MCHTLSLLNLLRKSFPATPLIFGPCHAFSFFATQIDQELSKSSHSSSFLLFTSTPQGACHFRLPLKDAFHVSDDLETCEEQLSSSALFVE